MVQEEYTVEQLSCKRKILNFMRWNYLAFYILSLLFIISIACVMIRGFNWGLDFTGGTMIEINLKKSVNINHIRKALKKEKIEALLIQNLSSSRNIMIRMSLLQNKNNSHIISDRLINVINKITGQNATIERIEFIGPSVGADLIQSGILALIIALVFIFIYIAFRFERRLATAIVISLIHDLLTTISILSLCQIEIDLTIIAALISVIGYSLNDSIVISDRIRENFLKITLGTPHEVFNLSLTQTLRRTLITSSTTLMIIMILYLFGGPVLTGFSLTMLIGVSIGTASSIYIVSALALKLGTKREHFIPQKLDKEGMEFSHPYFHNKSTIVKNRRI